MDVCPNADPELPDAVWPNAEVPAAGCPNAETGFAAVPKDDCPKADCPKADFPKADGFDGPAPKAEAEGVGAEPKADDAAMLLSAPAPKGDGCTIPL